MRFCLIFIKVLKKSKVDIRKEVFDFFDGVTSSLDKAMQSIALAQAPRYILELFFVTIFVLVLVYINSYIRIEQFNFIYFSNYYFSIRLIPQLQLIIKFQT